ncbi:MAG TPA: TrkA family potassium uptake protein [Dehalococcoidia bacterium]|nr:TrkA family potassium uptake protein [Dehalococcoidia bacterium]
MKKQVLILGLGRFGISLATTLFNMGHDVMAIDNDEKRVQSVASQITHAIQADATDETVLKELGVTSFDVAIVTMGEAIQNSVLSTILLKKLGVPYVIARAEGELHGSILEKIGADKVVYPEREMGTMLAHGLTLSDVDDYIPVATNYGVSKLRALPYFVGKTLSELELGRKGKWGLAVLLIKRGKEVIVTPDMEEKVKEEDVLILSGSDEKLEQFLEEAKKSLKEQRNENQNK